MSTTIFNKLVRDKIPEIIAASGKSAKTEILTHIDYTKMLDAKLAEEFNEYQESRDIEELADMLEVIYAIAKTKGICPTALEKIRCDKAEKNGSFDDKILLKEVFD